MVTHIAPKVYSWASILEDKVLEQSIQTSQMPFVGDHISLMPDAHYGLGSSVGSVIPTKDALMPAAVGVDIGCGMIAVRTCVSNNDAHFPQDLHQLRLDIERAIPLSPGNYNTSLHHFNFTAEKIAELEKLALDNEVNLSHSPHWKRQLGSLGGGNHFIEICLDNNDQVWLFLHSGSRGVGNKIAQKHIAIAKKLAEKAHTNLPHIDLAYLTSNTPEFDQYLRDLHWAQYFAYLNRAEMMDRLIHIFARTTGLDPQTLEVDRINCHHNYAVQERFGDQEYWITRKGAIAAHEGVRGLIPGSMGNSSYVVTGKGNAMAWCSAPHGAGRKFSRTEAKKRFSEADLAQRMVGIEYRPGPEWVDEIPDAYKDIDLVMREAHDLVQIDYQLRQIINIKGT